MRGECMQCVLRGACVQVGEVVGVEMVGPKRGFYAVKTYVRVQESWARSMRARVWAGVVRKRI